MEKSPDAFRTISEVAELLETPAHVLRFWESRFPQIRPVKRAGGRRYYRPADVALLTGIKRLLHDDGMTIRGVQKILREQGVKHVSGVADDQSADDDAALEAALAAFGHDGQQNTPMPPAEAETAQIIALQSALNPSVLPDAEQPLSTEGTADEADGDAHAAMVEDDKTAELEAVETAAEITETTVDLAGDDAVMPYQESPQPEGATQDALRRMPEPRSTDTRVEDLPDDLFAYRTDDRRQTSPDDDLEEAPMTLWAETDEPEVPQQAEVTVFAPTPAVEGESVQHNPSAEDAISAGPFATVTIPAPEPQERPDITEGPLAPPPATVGTDAPTALLATRLRALNPEALSGEDRETLGHLRQAAIDLRRRMMAPARPLS